MDLCKIYDGFLTQKAEKRRFNARIGEIPRIFAENREARPLDKLHNGNGKNGSNRTGRPNRTGTNYQSKSAAKKRSVRVPPSGAPTPVLPLPLTGETAARRFSRAIGKNGISSRKALSSLSPHVVRWFSHFPFTRAHISILLLLLFHYYETEALWNPLQSGDSLLRLKATLVGKHSPCGGRGLSRALSVSPCVFPLFSPAQ